MMAAELTNQRIYISASLVALPLFVLWSWRQRRLNAIEAVAMAQAPTKTVVIIGASWAGINVAHGLLKEVPNARVVLVSPSGMSQLSKKQCYMMMMMMLIMGRRLLLQRCIAAPCQ